LEAGDDSPVVVPQARRPSSVIPANFPSIRSGTTLEVAEIAWLAEGVSRETALSIPSVLNCRNLIVSTVVQLDLYRYRGGTQLEADYLVAKPDPSLTLSATLGGTVDDLIFHGCAYWRILDRDAEGYPRRARWTPVADVTPESRASGGSYSTLTGYRIAGVEGVTDPGDLIRFDSAIPGVLDLGGRTLAAALELEAAARRLAGVELPAGVLKNEGTELSNEEAAEMVAGFQAARRESGIAFLQGLSYTRENISAADLQLIEARANVATDVARLFSIPVAMIGASPSGNASALLYSNLSQQEALQMLHAVGPHLVTIEQTLSDVYPRGTAVAFNRTPLLLADPQSLADYSIALLTAGIIDEAEARSMNGIPTIPAPADLAPGRI
jgi:phage portal protein BeeE